MDAGDLEGRGKLYCLLYCHIYIKFSKDKLSRMLLRAVKIETPGSSRNGNIFVVFRCVLKQDISSLANNLTAD